MGCSATKNIFRKIAIKTLAILQTCDLAAILRYRRIFAPHRIGDIRLVAKMAFASSDSQLAGFPKIKRYFWDFVSDSTGRLYHGQRCNLQTDCGLPENSLYYVQ